MTDSAIRTEADLRERIAEMQQEADVLAIGRGWQELASLGFGSFTGYDWELADPEHAAMLGKDWRFSYSARRYALVKDAHTQPTGSPNLPPFCVDVNAYGATPTQAMVNLLSEARTKAAPK